MSFPTQPRKKSVLNPQGGYTPPCGHKVAFRNCSICNPQKKQHLSTVLDFPTEKRKATVALEKILKLFQTNSKAAEKAAFVISKWIAKK